VEAAAGAVVGRWRVLPVRPVLVATRRERGRTQFVRGGAVGGVREMSSAGIRGFGATALLCT